MKRLPLLCLTLLLALTFTACGGQTAPPNEDVTTTSSTNTSTTVDSEAADASDTATQETQETSTDASTSRSIHSTTVQSRSTAVTTTERVTTTKKVTTTTKTATTTKKPSTTTKKATIATTTGMVVTAQYESEVLRLVNIERAKQGLAALSAGSDAAMQAADVRAAEIQTSFSHTRPNGSSCFTALDEAGVSYRSAGENIAYGYQTPAAVVEGWMNSDGHRANILNSKFTHLAVGYQNDAWVQLFISI